MKPTTQLGNKMHKNMHKIDKRKKHILGERIILSKLQQRFYQNESIRTAEILRVKKELIELKHKQLNIETKLRAQST